MLDRLQEVLPRMRRLPFPTALRPFALGLSLVCSLLLLSGCDTDSYPESLLYPVRKDALYPATVMSKLNSTSPPRVIDRPGEFPHLFRDLNPDLLQGSVSPQSLDPNAHQHLHNELTKLFGTPATPQVNGISDEARAALRLDPALLAQGSKVYRVQCLHCHGLTGDGQGPTAPWVNPHPRDYRLGRFKFTSSSQDEGERKPRREDLLRTLRDGIEGSSMPSFRLLPDDDLQALVSYVLHLSVRGEAEYNTIAEIKGGDTSGDASAIATTLEAYLQKSAKDWMAAEKMAIVPGAYPDLNDEAKRKASVQNGYRLFMSRGDAGCIGCHLDFGRQNNFSYDVWGTIARPANLTTGVFRGGRRPIDLYYRIHSGINGSNMTAFGKALQPNQIWDLVNFLEILPYPKMRERFEINID
jgi:mono/diheme cytochrome c family protein